MRQRRSVALQHAMEGDASSRLFPLDLAALGADVWLKLGVDSSDTQASRSTFKMNDNRTSFACFSRLVSLDVVAVVVAVWVARLRG